MPSPIRLRFHTALDGACTLHRQIMPCRFLAPDFAPVGVELSVGSFTGDGEGWLSVNGLPRPEAVLDIARHKREGGKFLWSLDDDFLSIPDWNPAKPRDQHAMAVWEIAKSLSDAILVSTPALARTFSDCAQKVFVAPNMMDPAAFPPWNPDAQTAEITLPVKIGWAGGPTHREDVKLVDDALCEILDRFPQTHVRVAWFGSMPPPNLTRLHLHRPDSGLLYHQTEAYPVYQAILNQMRPDVWLCPLSACDFNLSKSAIRVFEAWALQACPVATPWGEYNVIRPGIDGRHAATTAEWVSCLSRLVTDHEYRLDLARRGRYRLENEYNWQRWECRRGWHEALAGILGCPVPEKPAKAS